MVNLRQTQDGAYKYERRTDRIRTEITVKYVNEYGRRSGVWVLLERVVFMRQDDGITVMTEDRVFQHLVLPSDEKDDKVFTVAEAFDESAPDLTRGFENTDEVSSAIWNASSIASRIRRTLS